MRARANLHAKGTVTLGPRQALRFAPTKASRSAGQEYSKYYHFYLHLDATPATK